MIGYASRLYWCVLSVLFLYMQQWPRLPSNVIQYIQKRKAILIHIHHGCKWFFFFICFYSLTHASISIDKKNFERTIHNFLNWSETNTYRLIHEGPASCVENLRMDKISFHSLCFMFDSRGYVLKGRHVYVLKSCYFCNIF